MFTTKRRFSIVNFQWVCSLKLFFSVPPSVRAVPSSGQITARKGGAVTLECKASGNPVPSIYWTKKVCDWTKFRNRFHNFFYCPQSGSGKSLARIGEGPILTLEKVERLQSGVYQCTAENNVGEPVTVDMRLDVLCKLMLPEKCCSSNYVQFPETSRHPAVSWEHNFQSALRLVST